MFDDDETWKREVKRLGIDPDMDVPKSIKEYHAVLEKQTNAQVNTLVKTIKEAAGPGPLTDEKFDAIVKGMRQRNSELNEVLKKTDRPEGMTLNIFDHFMRVAKSKLLPGIKEGHFRTPNLKDHLAGKGDDPFTNLMMALFNEAQERAKKK